MQDEMPENSIAGQRMTQRIEREINKRIDKFTHKKMFTVFAGTWNVNGQAPPVSSEDLKNWLVCDDEPPDIYAIGFQELDLSKEAFFFDTTPREQEWHTAISKATHPKAKYRLVALTRLVGIQLAVFVNMEHYSYVCDVKEDHIGTGILGKMGNKGGVAIRFKLHSTYLCFVNSHLAAHVEEVDRRNQDFNDINTKINFKRDPFTIKEHNQVYWLGDLNYRVMDYPAAKVKTYLSNGNLEGILVKDQLIQQKELGKVLTDYNEGDITFPPTYKYDLHSDRYDSSEKARAPAWTDRILFKGTGIYQIAYRSHMALQLSDHKPVSALFQADISVIDKDKLKKVQEECFRAYDKKENDELPHVTIETTDVKFENVKFIEPQTCEVIIANTGTVTADFEFINKPNDSTYCKDWLEITPFKGQLKTGQKIDLQFKVDLKSPVDKLEDIVVLHLEGGKDLFITIFGTCQRTCFTMAISTLCRCSVPISHLTADQLKHAESEQSPVLYSIPRELWLLIDHLCRNGLKTKELFETGGPRGDIIKIRDWLDNGSLDTIPGNIYAIADTFLIFLSFIKDPVIPYHLHSRCIAATNYTACKEIVLQHLPDLHRNVFLYICMFLQELLKYSNDNGLDAKTLGTMFSEVLLRDPIRDSRPQANRGKLNFIYHFLVNDQSTLIIPNK